MRHICLVNLIPGIGGHLRHQIMLNTLPPAELDFYKAENKKLFDKQVELERQNPDFNF